MPNETFQLPPEMRNLAEQSVEQARKAFDGFMTATHSAVSTLEGHAEAARTGARNVASKSVGFAERNVAASLDFAQKLVRAKSAEEAMALHAEYVKTQMQALADQARDIGQVVTETAGKGKTGV